MFCAPTRQGRRIPRVVKIMQFARFNLATCQQADGAVVVIDVLRAFSTAAYALAAGAEKIVLTDTVEKAFALKKHLANSQIMGEVDGRPVTGFDFSNSPAQFVSSSLQGKTLIQRTSSGTQGVIRATNAKHIWVTGFCNAAATVRDLRKSSIDQISFIITAGSEDATCADYLEQILSGNQPQFAHFAAQVRLSSHASRFLVKVDPDFPADDVDLCLQLDRFNFAMPVKFEENLPVVRAQLFQ